MRKWNMLMICMLAIALKSSGQHHLVLEGTIGKSPIVLMIEKGKENMYVTYYHKDSPFDKELYGEQTKSGEIIVKNAEFDSDKNRDTVYESMQIHEINKNAKWKGVWKDQKGNELPVLLTVLKTQDFPATKKSYFKYLNDSVSYDGKIQIQWNHETGSNIKSFKIISGYPDSILKKINAIIKEKQLEQINNFFSCFGNHNEKGDYDYSIFHVFFTETIMSIEAYASWYCGGVHPDFSEMCYTIDAIKGAEIKDLDDIFLFSEGKEKYLPDSLFNDDRGKNIVRVLSKMYPKEMAKPDSASEDCDYSRPSDWNYPVWYFTKKGLYLGPSFPHALAACGGPNFSIIPYSLLDQYLIKEKQISLPK
jgi:hypothetical protein